MQDSGICGGLYLIWFLQQEAASAEMRDQAYIYL